MAGIQPDVFWNLTYRDLSNYLKGYEKRNLDEWRRTRIQAYMVYAVNCTKEERQGIVEWMPLGEEKPEKPKLIDKKTLRKLEKLWQV